MLQNPDMMPTATINRWIDEICLYQFTLRHKAGVTFGPDGLSRRSLQEGDPSFEPCSDDEDEVSGQIEFEIADASEQAPLFIEEFVDQIDTRHGYFHGIANSVIDFNQELNKADLERDKEKSVLDERLEQRELGREQAQFLQQMVSALALPS